MPSGKKSLPPSASSLAQNLSKSMGWFLIGSRITLSPTLLTRTSVPSKRNSFGRRTAWLRPHEQLGGCAHDPLLVIDAIDRYITPPAILLAKAGMKNVECTVRGWKLRSYRCRLIFVRW